MTLLFISMWICLSKAPLERSCRALSETEDWYKIKKHNFCNPPSLLRNATSFKKEVTVLINIDGKGVHWTFAYFSYDIPLKTDVILSVKRRILITVRSFTAFRMTLFFISLWIYLSKAPFERSCRALSETEDWYKIKKHNFCNPPSRLMPCHLLSKGGFWNGISFLPRADDIRPYKSAGNP